MGKIKMIYPVIAGVVCQSDLLIKKEVEAGNCSLKEELQDKKIELRKVHNYGMFLNLLEKNPKLVKLCSSFSVGIIFLLAIKTWRGKGILKKFGMSLLLGGGLSNAYDHIIRGYVVDYIGFKVKAKKFSDITYNLGDFAIFLGAILQL